MTLGEVITSARDVHPAFTPQQTSDIVLARFLSNYQRNLVGKIGQLAPSRIASSVNIPLPLADFDAGFTLPGYKSIQGVTANYSDNTAGPESGPVIRIGWEQRFDARFFPSIYIHGGVLYLIGVEEDWDSVLSLDVSYIPIQTPLTALVDVFILPDSAFGTCVSQAALFMARRGQRPGDAVIPIDLSSIANLAVSEEEAFLIQVADEDMHNSWHVTVMP